MTRLGGALLVAVACSAQGTPSLVEQDDDDGPRETGGAQATGGEAGSGVDAGGFAGMPAAGVGGAGMGGAGMGGSVSTAGAFPGGGTATGGVFTTGGTPQTGGAFPTGGSATTGGAFPTGGTVATGGSPPSGGATSGGSGGSAGSVADPCATLGPVLWSHHASGMFSSGPGDPPATITHTLRVNITEPPGFCEDVFRGQGGESVAVTTTNGQTGTFATTVSNLCTGAGYPSGTVVTRPVGDGAAKPQTAVPVRGVCLIVVRNSISPNGTALWTDIDVMWEIRGR